MVPDPAVAERGIPKEHRDAALKRWDTRTAQALLGAGWYPGRSIPDHVLDAYDSWLRRLEINEVCYGDDQPVHWELVPAAREVLREFGGLTVQVIVAGSPYRTVWGEFRHAPDVLQTVQFFPPPDYADTEMYWDVQDLLGQCASPVARVTRQKDEVLVAADGTVLVCETYFEFGGGEYFAPSFDEALPMIIRLATNAAPGWRLVENAVFQEHWGEDTGRSLPLADLHPVRRKQNAAWIEWWDRWQAEMAVPSARPETWLPAQRAPKGSATSSGPHP